MFDLVTKLNRRDDLVLSPSIIASYTLDKNYVSSYQLYYGDTKVYRKIQPVGSVLALDPSSRKVVPNFTSYGFGVVGVLLDDTMVEFGDKEVNVVFEGMVNEKAVWDNGDYQQVLDATRQALSGRIHFVNADLADIW